MSSWSESSSSPQNEANCIYLDTAASVVEEIIDKIGTEKKRREEEGARRNGVHDMLSRRALKLTLWPNPFAAQ